MPSEPRVLVVGTTPDYVEWISQSWRGRALFITDHTQRENAREPSPQDDEEVLVDLQQQQDVQVALDQHIKHFGISPVGITCFDCESMPLTASLATRLGLPYPSEESIRLCRDKSLSKEAWRRAGVPCPDFRIVSSRKAALEAMQMMGRQCVIKPVSGTGSELVFACRSTDEAQAASQKLLASLAAKADDLIYTGKTDHFLVERMITGPEYSCDALLTNGEVRLIRLARKIPRPTGPFGCTLAYEVPACLPEHISTDDVTIILARAARSLKLTDTIFMADFIFSADGVVLLELTPRPGGDCLPDMIRHSSGLDMLDLALDFAEGRDFHLPPSNEWQKTVGVRIFAPQGGRLRHLTVASAREDQRICGAYLRRRPGDRIILPPDDYDSWILGHVVFTPLPKANILDQCMSVLDSVNIVMAEEHE
jgi:biotin carboxylase